MPQSTEGRPQAEVVLLLRSAIDTAIRFPHEANVQRALNYARTYPVAMRSAHIRHNLGQRRWDWLTEHGYYAALDPSEEDERVQGTIKPDYVG